MATAMSTNGVWRYLSAALTTSPSTEMRGGEIREKLRGGDDVETGDNNNNNSNSVKVMAGVLRVTVVDQGPGISKGNDIYRLTNE